MAGFLTLVFVLSVIGLFIFLGQYWWPRTAAFRDSKSRVRIWFGQGELVLWNPGQTFAFLKHKQLNEIGSERGGHRTVFAYKTEEAIGPISLQTALFTWNDENVLTSDGQPLKMSIGVWWKVADVEKYVFQIYNEGQELRTASQPYVPSAYPAGPIQTATRQPQAGAAQFQTLQLHTIADRWLKVLTESVVRSRVNRLTVAEVVSSQAMEFLHAPGASAPPAQTERSLFESVLSEVTRDLQDKARDFGLAIDRLEVQHVYLPKVIQDAINETRIAFLAPIKGEREAEAQRIALEKLVSVLGRDNVALNQIMSNLRNANFLTPLPIMQPLMEKVAAIAQTQSPPDADSGPPSLPPASPPPPPLSSRNP